MLFDDFQNPDKLSYDSPISTSVLKQVADLVASFIRPTVQSLYKGLFPVTFKEVFATTVLKKPGLVVTSVS